MEVVKFWMAEVETRKPKEKPPLYIAYYTTGFSSGSCPFRTKPEAIDWLEKQFNRIFGKKEVTK